MVTKMMMPSMDVISPILFFLVLYTTGRRSRRVASLCDMQPYLDRDDQTRDTAGLSWDEVRLDLWALALTVCTCSAAGKRESDGRFA